MGISLQQEVMHSGYRVRMRIESDRLYITKIKESDKELKTENTGDSERIRRRRNDLLRLAR